MLVKAKYFGFYPLGADVLYNNVRIMQAPWEKCNQPIFVFGKKQPVSPCLSRVFYVKKPEQVVFFVAIEHGLGHYHIFSLNERTQKKLSRSTNNI